MGRGDRPTQDHRPLLQGHINRPHGPDTWQVLEASAKLRPDNGLAGSRILEAQAPRDPIVDLLLPGPASAGASALLVGVLSPALSLPALLLAAEALVAPHAAGGQLREETGQIASVRSHELPGLSAVAREPFVALNSRAGVTLDLCLSAP